MMFYLMILPAILGIIIVINQRWGGVDAPLPIHIAETAIFLTIAWLFAYALNRDYQKQNPDPICKNWQLHHVIIAISGSIAMIVAAESYDFLRQTAGLPPSNPQNQQVLMDIMQQAPLQLMIYAGLIAPVLEEFLFRGMFMRLLPSRWYSWAMVVCSAFIFALPHQLPNHLDFIIYMTMGMILAAIYLKTRQLKYSILAHFINNNITLLIMWLSISTQ